MFENISDLQYGTNLDINQKKTLNGKKMADILAGSMFEC